MVRRMLALMLVALCAAAALGGGGGVRVVSFDESDGFSESPVTCVVQDSVGLIWLASWDGLYRYDGYRMRCYKARPGDNCPLNVNRIDYICELPGGDLLCRVRGEYFAFRRATGKFEYYEGPTRNLGRAYRPDARVRATVEAMPRYRGLPVRILLKDRQGGIWVQTMKGLDRISPSARPIAGRKAGTDPEEEVRALLEDRQGRLWVADKNGYVRLEGPGGQLVGYVSPSGRLEGRPVRFGHNAYCLCQDSRGWVWMGAKGSGLFRALAAAGEKLDKLFGRVGAGEPEVVKVKVEAALAQVLLAVVRIEDDGLPGDGKVEKHARIVCHEHVAQGKRGVRLPTFGEGANVAVGGKGDARAVVGVKLDVHDLMVVKALVNLPKKLGDVGLLGNVGCGRSAPRGKVRDALEVGGAVASFAFEREERFPYLV